MDQLVSRLLLYGDLGEEAILSKLAALFQAWKGSSMPRQTLVRGIYHQVKGLLDLATEYGFDENLWQNYLTFLLMTNENSFSLITERVGAQDGSVNHFARNDFRVFRALFHYDFSAVEGDLNLDCFTTLSHYKAIAKHGRRYNQNVSEKVRDLSRRLAAAPDDETFFRLVTEHYRQYGVGMLGLNKAFRIQSGPEGIGFIPIYNTDKVMLRDLVGYESQKAQLRHNTEAFLAGRSANNALLYGDAGTGKSSSVKALIDLPAPWSAAKNRRFLVEHQGFARGQILVRQRNVSRPSESAGNPGFLSWYPSFPKTRIFYDRKNLTQK